MTTTFERRTEESIKNFLCSLIVDETSRQDNYVSIIVLTNQTCYILVPCQSGSDTLVLVKSYCHALSTSAYCDTWIYFAILNSLSKRMCKIRIVNTNITVCTEIFDRITFTFKILHYKLLEWIAGMIACQPNNFYFHNCNCFKLVTKVIYITKSYY